MTQLEAINQVMREHNNDGLLKDVFAAMMKRDTAEADKCRKRYLSIRSNGKPDQWQKIVERLKYVLTCELFKVITTDNDYEKYVIAEPTYDDAKHWVINHLDCSKEWVIYNISKEAKETA